MWRSSTDPDRKRLACACAVAVLLWAAIAGAACAAAIFMDSGRPGSGSPSFSSSSRHPSVHLTLGNPLAVRAQTAPPSHPSVAAPVKIPSAAVSSASISVSVASLPEASVNQGSAADVGLDSGAGNEGTMPSVGAGYSEDERMFVSWLDSAIRTRLAYPERARRRNIEGIVVLDLVVSDGGKSFRVSMRKSSGSGILDSDAMRLVSSLFPAPVALNKEFSSPVKIQYLLDQEKP